ncbi:MAG: hypothetical protein AAGJ52_09995 [Pseudomonadota bacterium]
MLATFRPAAALAAILLCTACQTADPSLTVVDAPVGERSLAPRLTETSSGSAILSWLDVTETGHRFVLAEFDGEHFGPAREVARGDNFFANWADTPGVREAADGRWLAHWLVRSGRGTYAYDVVMTLSEDRGVTWSEPFSPHNDGTLTEHGFVSTFLAPGTASAIGAVWLDGRETEPAAEDRDHDHGEHHHHGAGAMTLRTATINGSGQVDNGTLLDDRVCDCCTTASAVTNNGVVVVYRDRSPEEIRDIHIVRQTETGWSKGTPVHRDGWQIAGCPVNGPDVIARGQQVFVAWFTLADDQARVQLASSEDGGVTFSEPQVFDKNIALGRVDLRWIDDGFVLSWISQTSGSAVWRLARFDSDGELIQEGNLRTLDRGRVSGIPHVMAGDEDSLWVTWTESRGDPAGPQVQFGRVQLDAIKEPHLETPTADH